MTIEDQIIQNFAFLKKFQDKHNGKIGNCFIYIFFLYPKDLSLDYITKTIMDGYEDCFFAFDGILNNADTISKFDPVIIVTIPGWEDNCSPKAREIFNQRLNELELI